MQAQAVHTSTGVVSCKSCTVLLPSRITEGWCMPACAAAGNESPVTAYMKSAGLMFENRESFGALVLFIEVCEVPRYFGGSFYASAVRASLTQRPPIPHTWTCTASRARHAMHKHLAPCNCMHAVLYLPCLHAQILSLCEMVGWSAVLDTQHACRPTAGTCALLSCTTPVY
jgi:hypothetical protein